MTDQPRPADRHWGALWSGLVVGWGIGALIGILRAPRSGAQTRTLIGAQTAEIALRVQEQIQRDPVREAIEEGKQVARARQSGQAAEAEA